MAAPTPQTAPVSVVVPARNEAESIGRVISTLVAMPMIDEVVVVDNGSDDGTGAVAETAGARVIVEARPGMGHAIRTGFIAARNDWVMKVDADLDRFNIGLFAGMIDARAPGIGLIKGQWQDLRDPMPMTRYLVMPALRQMFPGLSHLQAPNSGIYIFDRRYVALPEIIGDYAADLDVMIRVHAAGAGVTEVDIGRIENDLRDPGHYSAMSDTIMAFFLRCRDARIMDEYVVLSHSAVPVIRGVLGSLVSHARMGGRATVFLGEGDTSDATALRKALQGLPTVRIAPRPEAPAYRLAPHATALRIFVPHGDDMLHQEASAMAAGQDGTCPVDILSMPPDMPSDCEFAADLGVDISAVVSLKSVALTEIGAREAAPGPDTREVFQIDTKADR